MTKKDKWDTNPFAQSWKKKLKRNKEEEKEVEEEGDFINNDPQE